MKRYRVRMRYAGSVLVELEAEDEAQARGKGERAAADMNSDTFLSALELQHLGTEVMCLCSKCDAKSRLPGSLFAARVEPDN